MFCLGILLSIRAQDKAEANVFVSDFEDNPIRGAQVQFFNTTSGELYNGISNSLGKFKVGLPPGVYNIRLRSVGLVKDYSSIEIPRLTKNEVYNNVNIIIQFEEESSFTLSDLHFQTGESVITSDSYLVLEDLVSFLNLKPHLKIEIGGHTDNVGLESDNLALSQSRAEAVVEYLIISGIAKERLQAKGFGEEKPIASNNTIEGRALNRRTEVVVLD